MKHLLLLFTLCGPVSAHDAVTQEELVALEKRFELQLQSQEERIQSAMAASEKAIIKAEVAMEKRMEGMNEFRAQLKDQAGTFVTRTEALSAALGVAGVALAVASLVSRRKNEVRNR